MKVYIAIFLPHKTITPVQFEGMVRYASVELDCIMGVYDSLEAAQNRYGLTYRHTCESHRGTHILCQDAKNRYTLLIEHEVLTS